MKCFDVALWSIFPSGCPRYVAHVQARSAFEAIETLMQRYRRSFVMHASVCACDGSLVYRGHKVVIDLDEEMQVHSIQWIAETCWTPHIRHSCHVDVEWKEGVYVYPSQSADSLYLACPACCAGPC